jgi:ABC-type sugar transport system ATPase subunit
MDVVVEDLVFRRGRRTVLEVPGLVAAAGRTTALVGPNGAGKSTLLRLVAALERPQRGQVLVGGLPASPRVARERIAYAFQRPVFLSASVRSNIETALALRGVERHERQRRAEEVAGAFGISHLLDRPATRLSGGEAQRANLARALSLRAPVTLLDEPLAGLDGPARRQLLHELPAMLRRPGSTTIVVTHDRDEALPLADDLAVLIDGRLRVFGPRATTFSAPPDPETAAFLGYTLLPVEGGICAIAPRGLRIGPGDHEFELEVEEVLDFGIRREVWGRIAGVTVSVGLAAGEGPLPAVLRVSATARAVACFPASETPGPLKIDREGR